MIAKMRKGPSNEFDSPQQNGGDDRIRTCEGLLTLNDLANRRFQPLSHVSKRPHRTEFNSSQEANFVKYWCILGAVIQVRTGLTRLIFAKKISRLRFLAVFMRSISKRKVFLFPLSILTALLLFPFSAEGTSVNTNKNAPLGIIKGVVRDNSGLPISDASVAIFRSGSSRLLKQVVSAADGSYLARIVPGTYTVLAVAQGFNPVTLYGVQVSRAAELTYGFNLEPAGAGNTLPEKRLDKNSSKWRIRAAQSQRSIYQNREGATPSVDTESLAESVEIDEKERGRKGQTVAETYYSTSDHKPYIGLNLATLVPVGNDSDLVVAAQTGTGDAPHRLELGFKSPVENHQFRLNASVGYLGNLVTDSDEKSLGQFSFQVLDEWKVREGIVLVFGLDYSRFLGVGDDFSLSPRLGFQYDLDSKTRFRSAFTTQTEERSWANAVDLEGNSVAFREPVSVEDLLFVDEKPKMNVSRRLEFGVERIIDSRSSIDANIFLDTTSARGVGINSFAFDTLGGGGFEEFVADQQGRAKGIRVVYTRRLGGPLSVSAGYSFGQGQRLSIDGITDPAHLFENDIFSSFFGQLVADLRTGTSVRTVYRLSPNATVFAIDPFKGSLAIYDPGLSVLVTQHLPNLGLPFRAEAVIDARNIFDVLPGVSGEESGLKLNSHGRIVRGGIKVRF